MPSPSIERRSSPTSLKELCLRAHALSGHTLAEIGAALNKPLPTDGKHAKGWLGQLAEFALGADPQAYDKPDFLEIGVELKTVPINAHGKPAESTFCCSIALNSADREEWASSRLRQRLSKVLFLPVDGAQHLPFAERRFQTPRLWLRTAEEDRALHADWEDLMGRIGCGQSARLRGSLGVMLQVRPKAATSRTRRWASGPLGPTLEKPLGFYLRASFVGRLLVAKRTLDDYNRARLGEFE